MKYFTKMIGLIVLTAIIGFSMIACSNGTTGGGGGPGGGGSTGGSGQYTGKDVLGNSYSLSVGSDARAAEKGDRYRMTVTPRDGKTRTVTGSVTGINADGTLNLKTDTGEEFTTVVGGSTLSSVAGIGDEMPQIRFTGDPINGSNTLTPRSFDKIYLRATRWRNEDDGKWGEGHHWGSGKSALLRDFPTNVSTLQVNQSGRYKINISGTTDKKLEYFTFMIFGIDENDKWVFLTESPGDRTVQGTFNEIFNLEVWDEINLLDYKDINLEITNVFWRNSPYESATWNVDRGRIPDEIDDSTIMATISNFKISLIDTSRDAFEGNMNDFNYGIREDGWSADYRQAMWSLTAQNIADAKKTGAIFEFVMTGLPDDVDYDYFDRENIALGFAWQDPVRGLWWQDETIISNHEESSPGNWYYVVDDGVEWIPWQKKIRIDLAKVAKDSRFKNATELNFIVGYWWKKSGETECIDELGISGANIIPPPATIGGNLGAWYYGYEGNGVTLSYSQAVWSNIPEATLDIAKQPGAKLVFEFYEDISSGKDLALVWQDPASNRWWPSVAEQGTGEINMRIFGYDGSGGQINNGSITRDGITYDSETKKLTIVLDKALETYSGFKNAAKANLILDYWWDAGGNERINDLVKSASIVAN